MGHPPPKPFTASWLQSCNTTSGTSNQQAWHASSSWFLSFPWITGPCTEWVRAELPNYFRQSHSHMLSNNLSDDIKHGWWCQKCLSWCAKLVSQQNTEISIYNTRGQRTTQVGIFYYRMRAVNGNITMLWHQAAESHRDSERVLHLYLCFWDRARHTASR